MATYEYRSVHIPAHMTREAAREVLTLHAEYGGWELAEHTIWPDGRRKVTVRRRVRPGEELPPLAS